MLRISLFSLLLTTVVLCQTLKTAPDFKLPDVDKNNIELSKELGDGPILISFWATWCKPCMEEMTELSKVYNDYKAKGFKMIAVSIDNEKTVAKVKPFIKAKEYPFTVVLDTNGDVARKYYVGQIVPSSFLVDKNGKIVYQNTGYKKGDELKLRKKIEELL